MIKIICLVLCLCSCGTITDRIKEIKEAKQTLKKDVDTRVNEYVQNIEFDIERDFSVRFETKDETIYNTKIIEIIPKEESIKVPVNTLIYIKFFEPNPKKLIKSNFILSDDTGAPKEYYFSRTNNSVTLLPSTNLKHNSFYVVEIRKMFEESFFTFFTTDKIKN